MRVEPAQTAFSGNERAATRADRVPVKVEDAGMRGIKKQINRRLFAQAGAFGIAEGTHAEEFFIRRGSDELGKVIQRLGCKLVGCADHIEA